MKKRVMTLMEKFKFYIDVYFELKRKERHLKTLINAFRNIIVLNLRGLRAAVLYVRLLFPLLLRLVGTSRTRHCGVFEKPGGGPYTATPLMRCLKFIATFEKEGGGEGPLVVEKEELRSPSRLPHLMPNLR